jgi:flagellar basal body P-ring formation protein FlgA
MKTKPTFLTILCAAFVVGWPLLAGAAPQLRSSILVEGPDLVLGHIFEGAGDASGVRVGPSPEPGERIVMRPGNLARFAKRHGLIWTPGPAVNSVVVRRASTNLAPEDVEILLRQELRAAGAPGRLDLELRRQNFRVALPLDSSFDLTIERMSYDEETGRFSAQLRVTGPEFAPKNVVLDGTAHSVIEIPVATRTIAKGSVIAEDDIAWTDMRVGSIRRQTATELDQVVGKEAKRQIRPDTPIRFNDLWAPRLVRKGSLVTLTVHTRYMLLQTNGQAVEDGARGEVVRILNLKSRKTVQGIVTGDGEVRVPFSGPSQLAATN